MKKYIKNLPHEIILNILSYTYRPQSSSLLQDIVSYVKTKRSLYDYYYNFWIIEINFHIMADKEWLLNDIVFYANGYAPTMNGYSEIFYNLLMRNPFLRNRQYVDRYIRMIDKKHITTPINILLGLFNTLEREELLYTYTNMYNRSIILPE